MADDDVDFSLNLFSEPVVPKAAPAPPRPPPSPARPAAPPAVPTTHTKSHVSASKSTKHEPVKAVRFENKGPREKSSNGQTFAVPAPAPHRAAGPGSSGNQAHPLRAAKPAAPPPGTVDMDVSSDSETRGRSASREHTAAVAVAVSAALPPPCDTHRVTAAPSSTAVSAASTEPKLQHSGPSRKNHVKSSGGRTPMIIPLAARPTAATAATGAAASSAAAVAAEDATPLASMKPLDAFKSIGVDEKLAAKLIAPRGDSSSGGSGGFYQSGEGGVEGGSMAASAGIVRGHLRDGFGLKVPTRVQQLMIPEALAGHSVIAKSETGSGKTLAFLLPIVQGLLAAAAESGGPVRRSDGTRAIIIAPTRELCQQIYGVLTRLVQPFPTIVPCLLAGGEKRKSEKGRLRKGCTVVVATPGRLLDHLRLTASFQCDAVTMKWLVLDEADRLLDLGFGAQLKEIVTAIRTRGQGGHSNSSNSAAANYTGPAIAPGVVTFLLSATVSPAVRELALAVLSADAVHIDASAAAAARAEREGEGDGAAVAAAASGSAEAAAASEHSGEDDDVDGAEKRKPPAAAVAQPLTLSAPKTLTQSCMVIPLKWRLVTLVAVLFQAVRKGQALARKAAAALRAQASSSGSGAAASAAAQAAEVEKTGGSSCKAILFLSSCDSVDFHKQLLEYVLPLLLQSGKAGKDGGGFGKGKGKGKERERERDRERKAARSGGGDSGDADAGDAQRQRGAYSRFPVYRLHGNVPQAERTAVYRAFAAAPAGLLVATDVAARGLDLPAVDLIVQADAPSETQDYVHRVGRTARRGQKGTSLLLLQPHEAAYVDLLTAAGLQIGMQESAPALATLAEARIPLEPVTLLPQAGAGGKKDGKGGKLSFEALAGARAEVAEALVAAAAAEDGGVASEGAGGAGGGKDGTAESRARDPDGIPTRLKRLIDFANQVKHRKARTAGGEGGSSGGGGGGDALSRIAEAYGVAWQYWLEELVLMGLPRTDVAPAVDATTGAAVPVPRLPLLSLARSAFTSFVRAYATHERAVRHLFHPRMLHLGHAAKALGLREQPSAASRANVKEGEAEAEAAAEGRPSGANASALGGSSSGAKPGEKRKLSQLYAGGNAEDPDRGVDDSDDDDDGYGSDYEALAAAAASGSKGSGSGSRSGSGSKPPPAKKSRHAEKLDLASKRAAMQFSFSSRPEKAPKRRRGDKQKQQADDSAGAGAGAGDGGSAAAAQPRPRTGGVKGFSKSKLAVSVPTGPKQPQKRAAMMEFEAS